MLVRKAGTADLQAITGIYAHAVKHGTGTFEMLAPSRDEVGTRFAKVAAMGAPYLVAEDAGEVLGFAYAGPFRERAAYRFTVEDSIYVAEAARGRGVGRLLLETLITASAEAGFRQMLSLIGDSANVGSVRLHEVCGFKLVGRMEATGWKHGRWLDVVVMQRPLGDGVAFPAEGD